jgi:DnaK suppressor protein
MDDRSMMDSASMDASFMEQARRRLLARRDELAQRAHRTETDLHREHEPLVADFADQAIQRSNEDVLREIGASAREQLRQVNRALDRIESGAYLHCARCGAVIGEERLQVVPEAELCAACAIGTRL